MFSWSFFTFTIYGRFLTLYNFRAFNDLKKKIIDDPVALIVACPCPEEKVSKHGIIEIDSEGKVTSFLEKPKPTEI